MYNIYVYKYIHIFILSTVASQYKYDAYKICYFWEHYIPVWVGLIFVSYLFHDQSNDFYVYIIISQGFIIYI